MIVPDRTGSPPKRFTPRRLPLLSRPFLVLPAAFFDAILTSPFKLYFVAFFFAPPAFFFAPVFFAPVFFFFTPAFLGAAFFAAAFLTGLASVLPAASNFAKRSIFLAGSIT